MNKKEALAQRQWYVIDAEGKILGRMATEIAKVLRGGPADRAGVRQGDVLMEVEGEPVADPTAMLNLIAALQPGAPAKMKLKRQGQEVEATVNVGRRPKPQTARGGD